MNAHWLAIYTRPRWEKKVHALLQQKGIESYCPLNKVHRRWSDRIKIVEEPLFKSYVFVKVREEEKTEVRMTNGVVNFVYWNGRPAQIKESEIDTIRRFLNEYENVTAIKLDFLPNQRVAVAAGPMMGHEGSIVEVNHKTVKVCIESLSYLLVATLEKTKVLPAPSTKPRK